MLRQLALRYNVHASDEDGAITIIALFIMLLMLSMGGISIDLMRHEMERTQLQATLDSAVLAGAGAGSGATKQEIKEIVEDFFLKSGKANYLKPIGDEDIDATLNARRVSASADITMNTYLMKLMGVNQLKAAGAATAEVRTPKLEIVLVLDVSGSMNKTTRLPSLKTAAKEFVTEVLNVSEAGSTVISIVPFSWGVTPSDGMFEALNVDQTHEYSTCINFEDDDFLTPAINTTTSYAQRIYTSNRGYTFDNLTEGSVTDGGSANYNRTCFTDEYFRIMPYSINEGALHAKIDSLKPAGSTSQHLGMKWGAAMLDPAFDDVMTALQQDQTVYADDGTGTIYNEVDPSLTGVPALYNEGDTMKVIVMMGDGVNDTTYEFSDPNGLLERDTIVSGSPYSDYRGPESWLHRIEFTYEEFSYAYKLLNPSRQWHDPSQEWRCAKTNRFGCEYDEITEIEHYVYNPSNDRYYPVDGGSSISSWAFNNILATVTDAEDHKQYSWEEAWGKMSPRFISNLTGNWGPRNDFWNNRIQTDDKDDLMEDICTATKAQGVFVYTIGFEIAENDPAEQELRDCATESSYYYRASVLNISDAFGSIASNVQNLRLTQ